MPGIFLARGGANDLHLAARQDGLEDTGRIHAALRRARAHDGMHLIQKQDGAARLPHLGQDIMQALLKIAPVFGARHKAANIQ